LGMDNCSRALKAIMVDGVSNRTTEVGANLQTTADGIKVTVTMEGGANNPQTIMTVGVNLTIMAVVTGMVTTTDGELMSMNDSMTHYVIDFILLMGFFF
jgi:hypothetical protein